MVEGTFAPVTGANVPRGVEKPWVGTFPLSQSGFIPGGDAEDSAGTFPSCAGPENVPRRP